MWNFFLKTWILALVFSLHKKFVFINLLAFKRRKKTISHYINNIMCKRNTTLKRIILSFGTWRSRIWNDQQNMTNRVIYREWWTMRPTNLYWLYWAKAHWCKGKNKPQISTLIPCCNSARCCNWAHWAKARLLSSFLFFRSVRSLEFGPISNGNWNGILIPH